MTNEEILKKAVEKALNNGWEPPEYSMTMGTYSIIFQHDFAKAFFGNTYHVIGKDKDGDNVYNDLKAWQFHLQQMVIEKEPLKYLERFVR